MAYNLINNGSVTISGRLPRRSTTHVVNVYDFSGNFLFNGTRFTYMVLIAPYSKENGKMMKKILLDRKDPLDPKRSKTCLSLTNEDIQNYDNNSRLQTSAFFIVYAPNTLDSGSGTLQIYNQCSPDRTTIDTAQAWINDVCRTYPVGIEKSRVSPVSAMFYLIEQLVCKNLKKTETHLMVSVDNVNVMPLYNKIGYNVIPDSKQCNVAFDKDTGKRHYHIMSKTGLVYDGVINDELFNIELPVVIRSHAISPAISPAVSLPVHKSKKGSHGGSKRKTYKRHKFGKFGKRKTGNKYNTKRTKRK